MAMDPPDSSTKQVPDTNISTFVFLDFETTSLLDRKCRITELCLLAVSRVDMKETGNFPRVSNKLTLCLDPQMPISMTSSNITGLFDDSLEHQKALTAETVALVNAFLNHLSKPICLLAHNGNRFDFPLLVAELKRINQSLDQLLLCADTLEAFRSLDGLTARYDPLANQNSGKKNVNSPRNNNVTPSKSVTSSTQSPIKRKGTNDLETLNNSSPKVSKHDIGQEGKHLSNDTKLSVEKAKKKLKFDEIKSHMKKDEVGSDDTREQDEALEEFSGSLEDSDYLLALENVEKDLSEEKLGSSEAKEEIEGVSNDTKEAESGGKMSACSSVSASTAPSVSVKSCCVANGTGYFVRGTCNTDELSKNENVTVKPGDTPVKRFQRNNGASPVSVEKSCMLPSSVTKTKSVVERPSGTENQRSSTETKFSVALKPNSNPADCVQSDPPLTINDPPNTKEFMPGHSKPSPSVSEPVHPLTSDAIAESVKASRDSLGVELSGLNGSSLSRKSTAAVMSTTTGQTLGSSTVIKEEPCQITTSEKCISSGASGSTTSSVANVSSYSDSGTLLSSVASVQSSSVSRSVLTSRVNVPTASSAGTLTSLANVSSLVSGSALPSGSKNSPNAESTLFTGANVLSPSKSGPVLTPGVNTPNGSPSFQRQSYKLEEIYFRKFKCRPSQSHKAEDDCVALVKIAKFSPGFMEWVDRNAVLLTSVQSPF